MLDHARNLHVFDGKFTEIHRDQNNYNSGSTTYNTNSNNKDSYNTTDSYNDSSWRDNRNIVGRAHQSSARRMNTLRRVPHTEFFPRQVNEMSGLADGQETHNTPGTPQHLDLDAIINFLQQQQDWPRAVHSDKKVDEEEVFQTCHNDPFSRPMPNRVDIDPSPFQATPPAGASRFKSNNPFRHVKSSPAAQPTNAD